MRVAAILCCICPSSVLESHLDPSPSPWRSAHVVLWQAHLQQLLCKRIDRSESNCVINMQFKLNGEFKVQLNRHLNCRCKSDSKSIQTPLKYPYILLPRGAGARKYPYILLPRAAEAHKYAYILLPMGAGAR